MFRHFGGIEAYKGLLVPTKSIPRESFALALLRFSVSFRKEEIIYKVSEVGTSSFVQLLTVQQYKRALWNKTIGLYTWFLVFHSVLYALSLHWSIYKFGDTIFYFILTFEKMPECTCKFNRIEGEDNHECQLKLPAEKIQVKNLYHSDRPVDDQNPLR